jgi:hypothetical protein
VWKLKELDVAILIDPVAARLAGWSVRGYLMLL